MKFNSFLKTILFVLVVVFFVSCDKDYNEIGTNIIGDDHYKFEVDSTKTVVAYNQSLEAIQSNNLPVNALGYYNHPVFGKTKASFVTQLELIAANPKFTNPATLVIDSVYLYVPYFSTLLSTNEDGDRTFELDSLYANSRIKLNVFASDYYLRDFDASTGLQEVQKYYSNQKADFDAAKGNGGLRLNNSVDDDKENDEFLFRTTEIKLGYTNASNEFITKERLAPGMFLNLDKSFFRNKIIDAPAGKLLNNNIFQEYFRGLYFEVQNAASSLDQGSLSMLNFKNGKIVIVYQEDKISDPPVTPAIRIRKTLEIKLGGNSVNLFETENNTTNANFLTAMLNNTPDIPTGDERLYLKGQNGSMAVIELFGPDADNDGTADELEQIRDNGWLINEASLTFNIDKDAMFSSLDPIRVYLYDLKNNTPILDYTTDRSTNGSNSKFDKNIYGGIVEKEDVDNGKGIRYKIRLTNHLRDLIKEADPAENIEPGENVKLGLVVTELITATSNAKLFTAVTTPNDIKLAPLASVMNPLGTVIYGTSANVPIGKRLKLKIYYTKPD
jgi:hypothetical protein